MKKLFFLLIVVFGVSYAFADNVPVKDAEKVAKAHYYQGFNSISTKSWSDINLTLAEEIGDDIQYYVFNVNANEGFVVVSAENSVTPILAYSFEGSWNGENMSPGQKWFIDYYKSAITFMQEAKESPTEKITEEWSELLSFEETKGFKQKTTVGPLLLIHWNQDYPYNADCPEDSDGDNGHVYVGCVATAMLHVMKYYNYPSSGEGSKTHISWFNGGYGNITVNFAQQTYDWLSMPNQASGYNEDLAKINFHAGVSVSMNWGPDGSGAQTRDIEDALEDYFKYDTDCDYVEKSDYTLTAWQNLLRAQINQSRPMVYSGTPSSGAGHAWNCDGYQDSDHFHMNWGWGPNGGNGFYTLDDLNSTATSGGDENNFNYGQEAIIDIFPREGYPQYCNGTLHLTGVEGAFNDGSYSNVYQNNKNCLYTIEPECGAVVQLEFDSFDLGSGDDVYVYNGIGTDNELLGEYNSENEPPTSNIVGTNGGITIQFITDGSGLGQGWDVSYDTKNCRTNMLSNESQGVVNDGSGPCDYANSTVCTYFIQPNNAEWINLNFTEFDLAGNLDFVKVFKEEINGEVVGDFNQSNEPSGPMMVEASVVAIQFFADANNNGTGWTVNYTSSVTDVEENQILSGIQLYPNPSNGNSELTFYLNNSEEVSVKIADITGKTIANSSEYLGSGHHHINIGSLIGGNPESGVYFVIVSAENRKFTKKLVIVE